MSGLSGHGPLAGQLFSPRGWLVLLGRRGPPRTLGFQPTSPHRHIATSPHRHPANPGDESLKTSLPVASLTLALLTVAPAAARADGSMTAGASTPAGKNMVWNGAFDRESLRRWSIMFDSPRFGSAAVTDGELCFKLAEPSIHGVDVVMRQRPIAVAKGHHYQLRVKTHATAP